MRKDIKTTSKDLSNDILNNKEWVTQEISFIIDGSYDSYSLNKDILETYDINKNRRGKRGINLLARIGNYFITQAYNVNSSQALNIWNYLSKDEQLILDEIVLNELDYYIETQGE